MYYCHEQEEGFEKKDMINGTLCPFCRVEECYTHFDNLDNETLEKLGFETEQETDIYYPESADINAINKEFWK